MALSDRDKKILFDATQTDEPIFIFRAKDIISMFALKEYERVVEMYQGDDHEFLQHVSTRIAEFKDWQREHPEEIKLPD